MVTCQARTRANARSDRPRRYDPGPRVQSRRHHGPFRGRQGHADPAAARAAPRAGAEHLGDDARRAARGRRTGVDYHFLGDAEFDRLVAEGAFVEHAEYAGRRYGTLRSELERRTGAGEPVVLEIEVQGARQIRDAIPDALLVFIAPPSREALRERLVGRGTDAPEVVERRLRVAEEELAAQHEFAHVVVNDRLEDAVRELVDVVRGGLGGPVDSGA